MPQVQGLAQLLELKGLRARREVLERVNRLRAKMGTPGIASIV